MKDVLGRLGRIARAGLGFGMILAALGVRIGRAAIRPGNRPGLDGRSPDAPDRRRDDVDRAEASALSRDADLAAGLGPGENASR